MRSKCACVKATDVVSPATSFAAISAAELRIILHPKSAERGNVVPLEQVHQRVLLRE